MCRLTTPLLLLPPLSSLLPPYRHLQCSLVCRLLPLLYLQQRIRPDLSHSVPRRKNSTTTSLSRRRNRIHTLLKLLTALFILQQNRINPPLAKKIPFHFLGVVACRARRSLVHPVDALVLLGFPRGFLEPLQFLDLALLISFATELVDAFAFF